MAALPPYVPTKDADFDDWANNFQSVLAANPASYGATTSQAAGITAAYMTWAAAYGLVTSPATKTATTVSAKDAQRVTLTATLRPLAQQISLNVAITTDAKTAIGVNPRTSTPTPVTTPTTYPSLTLGSILSGIQVISYRDSLASPSVKSKPYGVLQIQLYGSTLAAPPANAAALPYLTVTTKSPFSQVIPTGPSGGISYYAGRWVTRSGLVGPWSPVVHP